MFEGVSGEVTAHSINSLATWMIENPLEEVVEAAAASSSVGISEGRSGLLHEYGFTRRTRKSASLSQPHDS